MPVAVETTEKTVASSDAIAKEPPATVPLHALVQAVDPLLRAYFSHDSESRRRDLASQERIHAAGVKRDFHFMWIVGVLVALFLLLAAILAFKGSAEAAVDLIGLVASIIAAAFGGYGFAVARQKKPDNDTE